MGNNTPPKDFNVPKSCNVLCDCPNKYPEALYTSPMMIGGGGMCHEAAFLRLFFCSCPQSTGCVCECRQVMGLLGPKQQFSTWTGKPPSLPEDVEDGHAVDAPAARPWTLVLVDCSTATAGLGSPPYLSKRIFPQRQALALLSQALFYPVPQPGDMATHASAPTPTAVGYVP